MTSPACPSLYNCYGGKGLFSKRCHFFTVFFSKGAGTNGWNASTMHILCIRSGNIMVMTMKLEATAGCCPRKRGEFGMICLNLIYIRVSRGQKILPDTRGRYPKSCVWMSGTMFISKVFRSDLSQVSATASTVLASQYWRSIF